jgi:hypothetical protein
MIEMSQAKDSFNSIVSLSEELCNQNSDMEVTELLYKISEYNQKIESYFRLHNTKDITPVIQQELEQLLSLHERMVIFFTKEKEKLSKNIKQIHTGKKMQNTYS